MIAASTERARSAELFQLQNSGGACLDCFHSGQPVQCPDLAQAVRRWPRFARAARDGAFKAVHALPIRLRAEIIGAMNLFSAAAGTLDAAANEVGQGAPH